MQKNVSFVKLNIHSELVLMLEGFCTYAPHMLVVLRLFASSTQVFHSIYQSKSTLLFLYCR